MRDVHVKGHNRNLQIIRMQAESEKAKTRKEKRNEKVKLLLQGYQVDMDKLMKDYLTSLELSPDEDKSRFNEANLKWKKLCQRVMKTHKDIKMNLLAFENTYNWIVAEHERQRKESEPKIISL